MRFVKLQQNFYKVTARVITQVLNSDVVVSSLEKTLVLRAQPDITIPPSEELKPFYHNWKKGDPVQETSESSSLERAVYETVSEDLTGFFGGWQHTIEIEILAISEQEDFEMPDLSPGYEQKNIRFYLNRSI